MNAEGNVVTVVHVVETLGHGGAERSLLHRIALGDPHRLRQNILCLSAHAPLATEFTSAGARVRCLGVGTLANGLFKLPTVVRELKSMQPDVVHTQLVSADILGRIAAFLCGRLPVVSSLQNMPYEARAAPFEIPRPALRNALKLTDRLLARVTRCRFLAVSETVRESYIRHLGIRPDEIEVVPNALDLKKVVPWQGASGQRSQLRSALGLPPVAPLVAHVGRHAPQKGLETLVSAMAELDGTGAMLVLIGSGGGSGALREQVGTLGLTKRVVFLGTRDDVPYILSLADVFAFPSLYEGLPVALLEAMASGVPAVASDLPEIREATGDTAVLVPAGDATSLAGAIRSVLSDAAGATRRAHAASQRAALMFDARRSTPLFEAALLRAVAERRHP